MLKKINKYSLQEHNLYNNILLLSRNKLFYTKFSLADTFQNRIHLIFIHVSFLFVKIKHDNNKNIYRNFYQKIFDLIFDKIELNMREIGHGDVTINKNREITSVFAGNLFEAHNAACETSKRIVMRPVENEYDIVITTNSGYPLDQNLYQTVKGLSAAAQIVKMGGTIICASECRDGLPSHGEYSKILSESNSMSKLLDDINKAEFTRHDQWQVQVQAKIQMRAEVFIKSDYLTDVEIQAAHFNPISSIEAAITDSINKHGKGARICVLPEGPQTVPYLSNNI